MDKLNVGALILEKTSLINRPPNVGIVIDRYDLSGYEYVEIYWCETKKTTRHSDLEVGWYLIGGELALWTIINE
jgi:hypothetical protein